MAAFAADVVIFGNTFAGLLAAKAVSARGRTAVVVGENTFAGGMTRAGLCYMDFGPHGSVGSIVGGHTRRAVLARFDAIYGRPAGTLTLNPEPHVVTQVVQELLASPGVTNVTGKTLGAVTKSGATITRLAAGNDTFDAAVYLDASYEGELMKRAGVTTHYGREALATYKEDPALGAPGGTAGFGSNLQPQNINLLDANGQRLYGANPIPRNDVAAGDAYEGVQCFNFRVCLTSTTAKRQTVQQPVGYKADDYRVLLNYLATNTGVTKLVGAVGATDAIFGGGPLHSATGALKYDCNVAGHVSSNLTHPAFGKANISWAYATADRATREAIANEHYRWIAGLIYFCQNDPAVASARPALQADAQNYGFANDAFQTNWRGQQGFPSELYVRECRRLVGQYVMTEADVRPGAAKPDPVCRFNYSVDIHGHQRYPRRANVSQQEGEGGYNQPSPARPYDIPWRAMLPAEGQADNLIVPWGISCSHIAWGALRLELNSMMQGEAAGSAACLAVEDKLAPVRLSYARLRPALLAQGALI